MEEGHRGSSANKKKHQVDSTHKEDELLRKKKKYERGATGAKEEKGKSMPYAGQWETASLGTEERGDKFLRLMGGFKPSNLAKTDSSKKSFASTALSSKKEDTLNEGLAAQYDQAFETTKQKRGLGLGYDPNTESEEILPTTNIQPNSETGEEKGKSVPYAGQWETASLGTEERGDKFLRLMGGFKPSNIAKTDSSKKSFASTALSSKKEDTLNEGLAAQYDQAFETTKQKRGLGLGYDPDTQSEVKPKLQPEFESEEARKETAYTGQWVTSSLGSEERSDKFLRLMGGSRGSNSSKD